MPAMQAVEPAEVAAPFEPPFRGRTADEILSELGLEGLKPASLVRQLAFSVEIGDYDGFGAMLAQAEKEAEALGNVGAKRACVRLNECGNLAREYEAFHGTGSARNIAHRFWPDVWERDNRLRAQGYELFGQRPAP